MTHVKSIAIYDNDVIMSAMVSHITGVSMVFSIACSGADQRKHQSSAPLAFVRGIYQWPINSPHKGPVTRKMFPIDDVIMTTIRFHQTHASYMYHIYQIMVFVLCSKSMTLITPFLLFMSIDIIKGYLICLLDNKVINDLSRSRIYVWPSAHYVYTWLSP